MNNILYDIGIGAMLLVVVTVGVVLAVGTFPVLIPLWLLGRTARLRGWVPAKSAEQKRMDTLL